MSSTSNTSSEHIEESVSTILEFLRTGDESVSVAPNQDVVLVLGNTGAGKSTFVQFIAGHDGHLISKEVVRGTGEYVIEDTAGRISNSTLISNTIYPELVTNINHEVTYYDCPGFMDTRSAKHDIASTYFIKKVIDESKSVKFLFLVGYPSVQQGVDRQGFKLLVKHATTLIKDVGKFRASIALIVTKVNNQPRKNGDQYVLVEDHVVIEAIAEFIQKAKRDLENMPGNTESVKFMDGLLTKQGQEYLKIGIFRRPDEPGPVSGIKLLQDGKNALQKIVQQNIVFTTKNNDDFGYSISENSKLHVHSLIEEIYRSLAVDIGNISTDIETEYEIIEEQPLDLITLRDKFQNGYDSLLLIRTEAVDGTLEPQEFINNINERFTVSAENQTSVSNQDKYLKFLRNISNINRRVSAEEWTRTLTDALEYLHNSVRWYRFVFNLSQVLSLYQNRGKIDTTQVMSLINLSENERRIADNTNLTEFLNELGIEYSYVEYLEIDESKANMLRNVLSRTVTYETEVLNPTSDKLVVKAPFVKLSDIPKYLNQCPEQIRFIEIFALNKIFIDFDLDLTGTQTQLSIIAPTWEIIGERNILLDGKSGNEHEKRKARNGFGPGDRGVNGKPGAPGGPAGNFFGIGMNFINGQKLTIFANGGKGAAGQEGGDGATGKKGITPGITDEDGDLLPKCTYESPGFYTNWHFEDFDRTGEKGQKGGAGGDGGQGGYGGSKGSVTIFDLQRTSNINEFARDGESGNDGEGGRGGQGGNHGYNYRTKEYHSFDNGDPMDSENYAIAAKFLMEAPLPDRIYIVERKYNGSAENGIDGLRGGNTNGAEDPETSLPLQNPSYTLNYYKNYLRGDLRDNILNPSCLRRFLHELETDGSINSL